jgi:hypothetical protein
MLTLAANQYRVYISISFKMLPMYKNSNKITERSSKRTCEKPSETLLYELAKNEYRNYPSETLRRVSKKEITGPHTNAVVLAARVELTNRIIGCNEKK